MEKASRVDAESNVNAIHILSEPKSLNKKKKNF